MTNLVFLTGAVSGLEAESDNRYSFVISIYKGDHTDDVLCRCTARHYETVLEAQETEQAITVSGCLKSYKKEGRSKAFVGVNDAMIALPFSDDENSVSGEAYISSNPRAYANRTIAYVRVNTYAEKWAYIPAVVYGMDARKFAMLSREDVISYNGYVLYDGVNSQLVIDSFKVLKGASYEVTQNRSAELQGENIRHQSGSDYVHQGRKPSWKNDSYRCRVRHSDGKDVRRNYGRQRQICERAWS